MGRSLLFVVVLSLAEAATFVDVAWWVRIVLVAAVIVSYLLVDTFTRSGCGLETGLYGSPTVEVGRAG